MAETIFWEFDIYVAGQTPKARRVYQNLKNICDEYLPGKCNITVSDLTKNPQLAIDNQITATPTIIRRSPLPQKILIGDLSNTQRATTTLEIK